MSDRPGFSACDAVHAWIISANCPATEPDTAMRNLAHCSPVMLYPSMIRPSAPAVGGLRTPAVNVTVELGQILVRSLTREIHHGECRAQLCSCRVYFGCVTREVV